MEPNSTEQKEFNNFDDELDDSLLRQIADQIEEDEKIEKENKLKTIKKLREECKNELFSKNQNSNSNTNSNSIKNFRTNFSIKMQNSNAQNGELIDPQNFISVVTKKIPTEINRNLNINGKNENFAKNSYDQNQNYSNNIKSNLINTLSTSNVENIKNTNTNTYSNYNNNNPKNSNKNFDFRNNSNRSFGDFEGKNNNGYTDKNKFRMRDKTFDNSISVKTKSNINKELSKGGNQVNFI